MRFLDRFINFAKADAHGVLDSLEDGGLILKQCLREAENELAAQQLRREELLRSLEQHKHHREALAKRADSLDEAIELAIGEDAEDLARFSIRRLLATQRKREEFGERLRTTGEDLSGLEARIASQDAELSELRDQVEVYLVSQRTAEAGCAVNQEDLDAGHRVREEEVELELLRRRQRTSNEEIAQ